jgi:hypothetical protein
VFEIVLLHVFQTESGVYRGYLRIVLPELNDIFLRPPSHEIFIRGMIYVLVAFVSSCHQHYDGGNRNDSKQFHLCGAMRDNAESFRHEEDETTMSEIET